jgi:hypothetical protein
MEAPVHPLVQHLLAVQHLLDVFLVIHKDLLNVTIKMQLIVFPLCSSSIPRNVFFRHGSVMSKSLEYLFMNSFLSSSQDEIIEICIMS